MKKIRVMALALIVAVALTGAGYAAWSTKITYNNTMRTANWCVYVENDAVGDSLVAGDKIQNFNSDYVVKSSGIESGLYDTECSTDFSGAVKNHGANFVYTMEPTIVPGVESNDTVNFKFFNMHPGTKASTRFEIRNMGTIPAKIEGVNVKVTKADGTALQGTDPLYNAIIVKGKFMDHVGNNTPTEIGNLGDGKHLYELGAALNTILVGKELKEQHAICTMNVGPFDGSETEVDPGLVFSIPANALKDGNKNVGMLSDIKVTIEFNFVQYNQNTPNL